MLAAKCGLAAQPPRMLFNTVLVPPMAGAAFHAAIQRFLNLCIKKQYYQTFRPEKPMKARAMRPAVTRAMGKPSQFLG